jgi:hypothetical protein
MMVFLDGLWTFANSPLGISLVLILAGSVASWVFTQKPEWKKIFDQHRGVLADVIRFAETSVDPEADNRSQAKMAMALRRWLEVGDTTYSADDVRLAIEEQLKAEAGE